MTVAARPSTSRSIPSSVVSSLPPVQPGDSAAADTLARAIALALADASVREQLLVDLRNSPLPNHGIDLPNYLRSSASRGLVSAIIQRSAIAEGRLRTIAAARGGLELVMPIPDDRASWSGSDRIIVAGTPFTVREEITARHRPFGYTVNGSRVDAPLLTPPRFPLLVLQPNERLPAANPVGIRSGVSPAARRTISTSAEERARMYVPLGRSTVGIMDAHSPCSDPYAELGCDEPQPGTVGVFLPSGATMSSCVPNPGSPIPDESQDRDRDGVQDACEYELAQAFHPQMQFMSDDCDISREPYWAASYITSPIDGLPKIQIFYAISYHLDCGSPRPDCPVDCSGHYGDSEFIVLEVSTDPPNPQHWFLKFATLSAHYGSRANSTGTYAGSDLEYGAAAPASSPLVWIAQGKHSNYRSQAVCDAGAYYYDNCDRPGSRVALEVLPDANLGSDAVRIVNGVASRVGGFYSGFEYMWADTNYPFLGWYPRYYGGDTTPYGNLLRDFSF